MMQNFMEPYSNNMALKAKKSNSSNHSDNEIYLRNPRKTELSIAAYGYGLAMWRHLKIVSP
jgi:hypothetical protein